MNHPAFENTALGRAWFEELQFARDASRPPRNVKARRVTYQPGETRAGNSRHHS